ncbi:MAG: hypothetical protein PHE56_16270 [Bacteroidales bacterium]|nr:hypothetical protein [Bacteroidales bacterium]
MKTALVAISVLTLSFSLQAFDTKLSMQARARIYNPGVDNISPLSLARISLRGARPLGFGCNPSADNIDYNKVFGNDYIFAENFIQKHPKIKTELISASINPDFAISIIFPELIRYSSILNIAETSALKTLYIQHGKDHIDFSIGYFQMKPSFAEEIEKYANTMAGLEVYDISDTPEARKKRIRRLDTLDGQIKYLILFVKIMESKTENNKFSTQSEKLKYFATAYNCGFTNTESHIKKMISQKHFSTDFFTDENTKYYCYADIAVWWYEGKR